MTSQKPPRKKIQSKPSNTESTNRGKSIQAENAQAPETESIAPSEKDIVAFLEKLDASTLINLKEKYDKIIDHKKHKEYRELYKDLEKISKRRSGLTLEELVNYSNKKTRSSKTSDKPSSTIQPKYHNPDNPEETWSGRGRPPKWVEPAEKKYGGRDALLITPESDQPA